MSRIIIYVCVLVLLVAVEPNHYTVIHL